MTVLELFFFFKSHSYIGSNSQLLYICLNLSLIMMNLGFHQNILEKNNKKRLIETQLQQITCARLGPDRLQ